MFACNENKDKIETNNKKIIAGNDSPTEGSSIIQLDERLLKADSLVFVFYKNPHGKDSLRYTRYYTQYAATDKNLIDFLKNNLRDSTRRWEKIKKCRSEGKIWCFTDGNIFQTVYFSSLNNECGFVYIIKNGQFYYSKISNELSHKLVTLKNKAVDLKNEGE